VSSGVTSGPRVLEPPSTPTEVVALWGAPFNTPAKATLGDTVFAILAEGDVLEPEEVRPAYNYTGIFHVI
jgi:hypothetical protein